MSEEAERPEVDIWGSYKDPVVGEDGRFNVCLWDDDDPHGDPIRYDLEDMLAEAVEELEDWEPRHFLTMMMRTIERMETVEKLMKEDDPRAVELMKDLTARWELFKQGGTDHGDEGCGVEEAAEEEPGAAGAALEASGADEGA